MCKKSLAGWQIIYKYIKKVLVPTVLGHFRSASASDFSASAASEPKKTA